MPHKFIISADGKPNFTIKELLGFITTMLTAGAYHENLDEAPYKFLQESNLELEMQRYINKSHHIKSKHEISWGEAFLIIMHSKVLIEEDDGLDIYDDCPF